MTAAPQSGVDRALVKRLKDREDARFAAAHPRSAELMARAREYRDFNIADMSMSCGYGPEPLVRAVSDRMSRSPGGTAVRRQVPRPPRGNQFLLPNEDAIVVSEELARRFGLPKWQYTSSATHGRVVIEERGVPAETASGTVLVPFNDEAALARALEGRDVAIVLTEPAIMNNIGLLLPDDGFHATLRRLTRETGTLLAYDETHTQVVGPGGLVRQWGLQPDLVTAGKSIAGGVPFGAWGMTDEIAEVLVQRKGADGERSDLVATGGTIFGNALAMAAARAVLTEILTPAVYEHTQRLGARLADGMRASAERHGLPWHIHHLGPRSGYTFHPTPIRTAAEGRAAADELLTRLIRIWLANRGVWEAIVGAGPVCAIPATDGLPRAVAGPPVQLAGTRPSRRGSPVPEVTRAASSVETRRTVEIWIVALTRVVRSRSGPDSCGSRPR